MTPTDKILTALNTLLTHRERQRAVARPARVLGRHEDGTERLQRLDAACVTRASRDNHYTGTIVLNPGLSTIQRTGTAGIATITEIAAAPTLWIESLTPSTYQPNRTYAVTVTGRGFDDRVRIDFLEPAPPSTLAQTINPDIEVLALEVLDPETLRLEIAVAPGARLYRAGAPIAYGRTPAAESETAPMATTQLPNRKPDAYTVDLRIELADRELILPSSLKATTWDLHGDRLLYTRDVWRYRVVGGTEEIYDFGHVDTEIMALPASELPMTSAAQGTRLVLLDHIPVDTPQAAGSQRVPQVLAADPGTGNWIVYSHRDDLGPPFVTDLACFDPTGNPLSTATLVQPDDVGLRWEVPHAVVHEGFIYAIERDFRHNLGGSTAPGIVVRRQVGTVGSLTVWWSPEDEWVYPHSVSVGESHVFVAATRLFNPGLDSFQRSYLYWLDKDTLAQADVRQLLFNPTDNDGPRPYFLGMWEAAAGRNTGGLVLHDPADGTFLASGISPNGYHPDWFNHPRTLALFRFAAVLVGEQPFVHLADLGDEMPVPMCRTATGLYGNWEAQLPEMRNL